MQTAHQGDSSFTHDHQKDLSPEQGSCTPNYNIILSFTNLLHEFNQGFELAVLEGRHPPLSRGNKSSTKISTISHTKAKSSHLCSFAFRSFLHHVSLKLYLKSSLIHNKGKLRAGNIHNIDIKVLRNCTSGALSRAALQV